MCTSEMKRLTMNFITLMCHNALLETMYKFVPGSTMNDLYTLVLCYPRYPSNVDNYYKFILQRVKIMSNTFQDMRCKCLSPCSETFPLFFKYFFNYKIHRGTQK